MERDHPIPQEGPARTEPGADLKRLPSLWDAIYGQAPGYLAVLSGLRTDRNLVEPRERFYRFPADVDQAIAWIRREASAGRELYQSAHLLTEPRRRKETAAPLASLYADIDHADARPGVPAPTVLVESSPGKRQGYWGLTRPVAPAYGEELNRRLATTLGADPSGFDLTQLLRVPGTQNHKYPEAPLVRLLSVSGVRYAPEALARLLVPLPPRRTVRQRPQRDAGDVVPAAEPPVSLSRPARAVWDGRDTKLTPDGRVDRSASLVRLARVLYEAGLPAAQLPAALAERDTSLGWQKYTGRPDAWDQYGAITAFVVRGTRTQRRTG